MKTIKTIEDVYLALDQFIEELRAKGDMEWANLLDHRLHKVAWTTHSELLEEVRAVLTSRSAPNETVRNEIGLLTSMIDRTLDET
jgi:hypothetical protein